MKVIMVAYDQAMNTFIRTMNTKHERCGMAFLLQAAHKIAVSCPKKKLLCKLIGQMKSSLNTA